VLIGISLAFIRLSPNQTSPSFVRS
jgi:hypothetical protein